MKTPIFGLLLVFLVAAFVGGAVAAPKKPKPCKNCYCSVISTDVYFGAYDGLAQLAVDSAGNIEVTCGTDTIGDIMSYQIELSGAKKGSKPREMAGPKRYLLEYNIYTDVSHMIIWGDGKGSTVAVPDSYSFPVLCCVTRNYTTYGRIDSGQNVAPGLYMDSIVVTINF